MTYKLGSLFDGSGGFPLSGSLCGIEPVWAAEVEPYPIAVTRSRFPNMKHLGDISKVNGREIEPVDIITFGSPCQDLSVAGKRAGLKHEANGDEETTRSGLFMEAVRIIKEMRKATGGQYPRFALWENVPGAFSSQKGEDFRVVLEELIRIIEPRAVMPPVPKAGWAYADSYTGDGWSLAYRVFDAQYWGVPQRRRRIHLVVDFGGQCAREVLFEREGVRGYFAEGRTPWQTAAGNARGCAGADDRAGESDAGGLVCPSDPGYSDGQLGGRQLAAVTLEPGIAAREGGHVYEGVSGTLRAEAGDNRMAVAYGVADRHILDDQGGQQINVRTDGKCPTLRAEMHGNIPAVIEPKTYDARGNGDGQTVNTLTGDHNNRVTDYSSVVVEGKPVYCLQGNGIDRADTAGCNGKGWKEDTSYTLNTIDRPAVAYAETYQKVTGPLMANSHPGSYSGQDAYQDMLVVGKTPPPVRYIVRRLTPTECARLQGFADRWGNIDKKDCFTPEEYRFWLEVRNTHAAINGKQVKDYTEAQMLTWYNKIHTDSAEYKMWGNGIALPPALYCLQGIVVAMNKAAEEDWLL